MNGIFIDNFKGFTKTFFPFKKINFFVGENSTGKTSLLKLINLFSETNFWISLDLNSSTYYKMGYFNEISSESEFTIGFFQENNEINRAIKLHYINNNGVPAVKKVFVIFNDLEVEIIIQKKQFKYKYRHLDLDDSINIQEWFKKPLSTICSDRYRIRPKFSEPIGLAVSTMVEVSYSIINKKRKNKEKLIELNQFFVYEEFSSPPVIWLSPTRDEPKRIYESFDENFSPSGTHTPNLLKNAIGKKQFERDIVTINDFGLKSGLFNEVSVSKMKNSPESPFELKLKLGSQDRTIVNVGFGISQVFPLLIEIMARGRGTWYAIQQPEVHLHPKAQAAFGEFIFNISLMENKTFFLESHSDFLIDRLRIKCNKSSKIIESKIKEIQHSIENQKEKASKNKNQTQSKIRLKKSIVDELKKLSEAIKVLDGLAQVVYFEREEEKNLLSLIPIYKDGSYSEKQPENFKEFFIKEQLELIKI